MSLRPVHCGYSRRLSSYASTSIVSYSTLISFALRQSSVSLNCLYASSATHRRARRNRLPPKSASTTTTTQEQRGYPQQSLIITRRRRPRLIQPPLLQQRLELAQRRLFLVVQVAQVAVGVPDLVAGDADAAGAEGRRDLFEVASEGRHLLCRGRGRRGSRCDGGCCGASREESFRCGAGRDPGGGGRGRRDR